MTVPGDFLRSSREDVAGFQEFFSTLGTQQLNAGLELMIKNGESKVKFSRDKQALTIRFTPEMQAKWKAAMEEVPSDGAPLTAEVSRRASGEFAAAFKDGQILIEVKEGGKRFAYASEKTAENIRNGTFQLRKNGKEQHYDGIRIMDHSDFEAIANSFILHVQAENTPSASLSSEHIVATKDTAVHNVAQQPPTATAIQAAKKTAQAPLKKPKKPEDVEEEALLRKEERDLENERDRLHEKLNEEKKILREKEKVEDSEIKHEEIAHEELKKEDVAEDPIYGDPVGDQGSSVPS
ncbi:MAG: hypothetical protein JSR37_08075 [Verrucomicrobia bacterium]|nr:hypothetical protein [Verrucomicrobiota bacterium]MBS0637852.1 hypothetical protein [Verrucomicrobiota bacterium]